MGFLVGYHIGFIFLLQGGGQVLTCPVYAESDAGTTPGSTDPSGDPGAADPVQPVQTVDLAAAGAVLSPISDQKYTGSALKPAVTLQIPASKAAGAAGTETGMVTLKKGTDYKVTYGNNTSVGTASVTITGTGSYSGTVSGTFRIMPKTITSGMIGGINKTYIYTSKPVTPSPKVKNGKTTLKKNRDYTVAYKDNVNEGTAKIIITGIGNFTGTVTVTFKIQRISMSKTSITFPKITYNGKARTPTPTVKYGSSKLKKGTDYTITYSNNTEAGRASAVLKGKVSYKGSVTVTFRISPRDIAKSTVSSIPAAAYTGEAIVPDFTVKYGSTPLIWSKDYTYYTSDTLKVGTAKLYIRGKSNYSGVKVVKFKIKSRSISKAAIQSIPDQIYTGETAEPKVTVTDGADVLKEGTHYRVSYLNAVNAGKAKVKVTGRGLYSGSITKTFSIVPRSLDSSCLREIADQIYTGSGLEPDVTVKDGSYTLVKGKDYSVSYSSNRSVGTGTARITLKGNYTGTLRQSFRIVSSKKRTAVSESAAEEALSDVSSISDLDVIRYDGKDLQQGPDFVIEKKAMSGGSVQVIITFTGEYKGSYTVEFWEDDTEGLSKGDLLSIGGLEYEVINARKHTVKVTGAESSGIRSLSIPDTIQPDGAKYRVTAVAGSAFRGCSGLTRVSIGKYVTSVGASAWYGDSKVSRVTFRGTLLKSIGKKAFRGISKKAKVSAPKKVLKKYKKLIKKSGGF